MASPSQSCRGRKEERRREGADRGILDWQSSNGRCAVTHRLDSSWISSIMPISPLRRRCSSLLLAYTVQCIRASPCLAECGRPRVCSVCGRAPCRTREPLRSRGLGYHANRLVRRACDVCGRDVGLNPQNRPRL